MNKGRQEALDAVNAEREYQDRIIANDPSRHDPSVDDTHTVGNYCTMSQHYVNELCRLDEDPAAEDDALLHVVRKLCGIAVHCLEDHVGMTRAQVLRHAAAGVPGYAGVREGNADAGELRDYVDTIRSLQNTLVTAWTLQPGHDAALEVFAKLADVTFHCLEELGAPKRT